MNKTALIIITAGLLISLGFIVLGGKGKSETNQINKINTADVNSSAVTATNTEIKDGIQYITINAKGGYLPRLTTAKAGLPTKLIMKTDGTYDCSASLVLRSIDYQKILPKTGEEVIDLGIPKTGPFQGMCGMGMYNFRVDFE